MFKNALNFEKINGKEGTIIN